MRFAMTNVLVAKVALIGALLTGTAGPAAAVGLQHPNLLIDPIYKTAALHPLPGLELRSDDAEFAITEPRFELPQADRPANAPTIATRDAMLVALRPVELRIQALAGHRSFDTMRLRRAKLGWQMSTGSNALGIGMTGSYGIRIARGWRFTPFAALDYNRVDSARIVDANSPNPFVQDNADTGLTASAGATMSHRFRALPKLRIIGFGAVIAGADDTIAPRDSASVASRVLQSLGSSGPDAIWYEVGGGADYTLSPTMRVGAGVVGTMNRASGEAIAGKVSIRIAM